jgi:ribosomal protein L37AE/L43A
MATFSNNIAADSPFKFSCEICNYYTSHKSHFNDHLVSLKHIRNNELATISNTNAAISKKYCCENCGKKYAERTGLWRHKKKCTISNSNSDSYSDDEDGNKSNNNVIDNGLTEQLVIELIRQNKELLEIVKTGTHNNNSINTHTNSHNKAFNLQFFLNETCKEAMNMSEFIDNLTLELTDLEDVGEKGYIQGISNIIVKNLKTLDITKRPVHCTDKKRETVYIKDNDIWKKDEDKNLMHKLVKKVAYKNINMFQKYRDIHPDCIFARSKFNDQYQSIVYESMGGKGDDDIIKNEKIIKNILKEVVVKKADEQYLLEV